MFAILTAGRLPSPCPSEESQDYTDTNETQPLVGAKSNESTTPANRDNDADAHDDDVRAPSAPFCLGGLLEQPKVFPHSGMVSTTPLCNSAYICGANCVYC